MLTAKQTWRVMKHVLTRLPSLFVRKTTQWLKVIILTTENSGSILGWIQTLSSPQRPNDHEDFYIMDIWCYSVVIARLQRKDDHSLASPNEDVRVVLYLHSSTRPRKAVLKLHNTMQHNTKQHNTMQHNATQHNATQHNTVQLNTIQYNTTQHIIYWLYGC